MFERLDSLSSAPSRQIKNCFFERWEIPRIYPESAKAPSVKYWPQVSCWQRTIVLLDTRKDRLFSANEKFCDITRPAPLCRILRRRGAQISIQSLMKLGPFKDLAPCPIEPFPFRVFLLEFDERKHQNFGLRMASFIA